jgi:hypothetical protein
MRRKLGPSATLVVMAILAATTATGATPPTFTFTVTLGGCFSGTGPPNSNVSIRWRDKANVLKGSFNVAASSGGNWFLPDTACQDTVVAAGDWIRESANGQSHAFTVPQLHPSFNRDTDVVSGKAAPNTSVQLAVWRNPLVPVFLLDPTCTATAIVNAKGTFAHDFTNCSGAYQATGGDWVDATWDDGAGDQVGRRAFAPYVQITLGSPLVTGYVTPGAATTINLRTSAGALRGTADGQPTPDGSLRSKFKRGGNLIKALAGNRVDGDWAGAVKFTIPLLSLSIDTNADTIIGHCMPHVHWMIVLRSGNTSEQEAGVTDASGQTSKTDAWLIDVQSGQSVTFWCQRASGDRFRFATTVP